MKLFKLVVLLIQISDQGIHFQTENKEFEEIFIDSRNINSDSLQWLDKTKLKLLLMNTQ